MNLERELLEWIDQEADSLSFTGRRPVASVHLIIIRLALRNQLEIEGDMTRSVELSLKAYERANLFRTLRQFERRGLIEFVDSRGKRLQMKHAEAPGIGVDDWEIGYVALTERGTQEVTCRKLIAQQQALNTIEKFVEQD